MEKSIFISYAREDYDIAQKLYFDLKNSGLNPWLDRECLLPGQNWKIEILKNIRNCSHFIAIISSNSVNKKGYVQKELKEALEILDEFPESHVYLIPVRLDDCSPSHIKLHDLQWIDLFQSYEDNIKRILQVLNAPISNLPSFGPLVEIVNWKERRPRVTIEAYLKADLSNKIDLTAIIDTGAVMSAIPKSVIESFGVNRCVKGVRLVKGTLGRIMEVPSYYLNLQIGGIMIENIEMLALEKEYAVLGWDILKDCTYLVDGPKKILKIWKN